MSDPPSHDPRAPTHLLTTGGFFDAYGAEIERVAGVSGGRVVPVTVAATGPRIDAEILERVEIAFLPSDPGGLRDAGRRFFAVALRAPKLRWMQLPFSGLDAPIFRRLALRGVKLTNAPAANAEPIAQTAIAGLLSLARGFPRWWEAQRRRQWAPHDAEHVPRELRGQTLVLLGVGAIGGEIARLARAFGLRVVGVRRGPGGRDDPVDELHRPEALPELLSEADWLVIACPLSDETRGWIGADMLERLPPTAHLINVARGTIVDEKALVGALRAGRLAGAYLDVFETEPLPRRSPLWKLPNVIISPHDSRASQGIAERAAATFLENLGSWLRGEALHNEVFIADDEGGEAPR